MTALHWIIEAAIIAGLAVLVVWLLRELGRWADRAVRRHVEAALSEGPVRQQDVAATQEAYARWYPGGRR